jgi:hypothetical protein
VIGAPTDWDPLDEEEVPRDDGTADSEVLIVCPHCGETNELSLDPGSGPEQQYVEDCHVCCRPWRVTVRYGADGAADVFTEPLDD